MQYRNRPITNTGWTNTALAGAHLYETKDAADRAVRDARKKFPHYTVRSKEVHIQALGVSFTQWAVVARVK